ncbi:MAG: hypothetical protein A2V65_02095 [Deltaproteobacteria bacterium RBG_13_49_15]|nr:MAG: hypothetical protein A2V65_02095 [Deltaproteobacteria bacterium RBG_13_49_15]
MKRRIWLLFLLFLCACQTGSPPGPGEKVLTAPQDRDPVVTDILGPQSQQALGEIRLLVVPVRFPDAVPQLSLDQIRTKAVTRLNDYVKAQSYGRAWINAHMTGWVPLPDSLSEYRVSSSNFKVDRNRVRKLIEDTMTGLEKKVDFAAYQHMLIVPGVHTVSDKGYGMVCYCANPGMLTGVRRNPQYVTLRSKGGKEFSGGVFVGTENSHIGMFAHDFFHALGGVYRDQRLVP